MGRYVGQPVHGLLLVDKEAGFSSNAVVQRAKRLMKALKVGHTGSLDPIATGVLPLCFGEATKLSGFLLDTDKRYQVRVRLGTVTTTADIEGEVVETQPVPALNQAVIEAHLAPFRGAQLQIPPMYSALKHEGRRLYDLARQGKDVERRPRAITIHELNLLQFGADWLDLDVHCSKGTYIRSLAVDLGTALGCGGHVEILRRTAVGRFTIDRSITLTELERQPEEERAGLLLPMDVLVDGLPSVNVSADQAIRFLHGQKLSAESAAESGTIRIYGPDGQFLGLAEADEAGGIQPKRVLNQ